MRFECVEGCAQCCIERQYYPAKRFGKIGVLVLPEEKERIERLAGDAGIPVSILPRIGVSDRRDEDSIRVLAYQMMGIMENGDTCPFLDTHSGSVSPHGGYPCKIYSDRPLACRAYPLIETEPPKADKRCKFCKECGSPDGNIDEETESLVRIKESMATGSRYVWRYATGTGEKEDMHVVESGWIPE